MAAQIRDQVVGRGRVFNCPCREVVFSVVQARRALRYVVRVARDAADAFDRAQHCRHALSSHAESRARAELTYRRDAALDRLNAAIDECNEVGADLMDISLGVVRFSTLVDQRPASLVWRLGEPVDTAWLELSEPG